jgi:hypothetical protein
MRINKLELLKFDNLGEQKWFSYIKKHADEIKYGTVKMTITVKNKEITNIKVQSEESFSVQNN